MTLFAPPVRFLDPSRTTATTVTRAVCIGDASTITAATSVLSVFISILLQLLAARIRRCRYHRAEEHEQLLSPTHKVAAAAATTTTDNCSSNVTTARRVMRDHGSHFIPVRTISTPPLICQEDDSYGIVTFCSIPLISGKDGYAGWRAGACPAVHSPQLTVTVMCEL